LKVSVLFTKTKQLNYNPSILI